MDALDTIATSTLFRGLVRNQCASFVPVARERQVPQGEYLFRLGQEARALFIVRSGVVELTVPLAMNGRERDVVMEQARAGETVAWSALIEPYRFTMSGRTATDVGLLEFARTDLQAMLALNPEAGVRIMTNLAKVVGRRLHVVQAMWNRELQRTVTETFG